jgi:hypothetical protein
MVFLASSDACHGTIAGAIAALFSPAYAGTQVPGIGPCLALCKIRAVDLI